MTELQIRSVSVSNYEGMDVLVDYADRVYLGLHENYIPAPAPGTSGLYDNSDGSLQFVSDNVKMYHFLYGEGWPIPQRQMRREHCFTKTDYIEFAALRDGVLAQYPLIREVTFAGQPFVPPKAYRRIRRSRPICTR